MGSRSEVVAFRLSAVEKAALEALARYEATNVATLLHQRIVPWAQQELARRLMGGRSETARE